MIFLSRESLLSKLRSSETLFGIPGVHLLLINQYYPPDEAPTGLMLESVAEELVAMGHEVTVLCSCGG